MPEPQDPRGEVSADDASGDEKSSSDGASAGSSAESGGLSRSAGGSNSGGSPGEDEGRVDWFADTGSGSASDRASDTDSDSGTAEGAGSGTASPSAGERSSEADAEPAGGSASGAGSKEHHAQPDTERIAKLTGEQAADKTENSGSGRTSSERAEPERTGTPAPKADQEAQATAHEGTERLEKPGAQKNESAESDQDAANSAASSENTGRSDKKAAQPSEQTGQSAEKKGSSREDTAKFEKPSASKGPETERIQKSSAQSDGERKPSSPSGSDLSETPSSRTGQDGTDARQPTDESGKSTSGSEPERGTQRLEKPPQQGAESSARSGSGSGKSSTEPATERIEKPTEAPRSAGRTAARSDESAAEQTQQIPPVGAEDSTQPHRLGAKAAAEVEEPTQRIEVPEDFGKKIDDKPAANDSALVESGAQLLPKPIRVADDPPPAPGPLSWSQRSASSGLPGLLRNHRRLLVTWLSALVVLGVVLGVVIGSNGLQQLAAPSPPSPVELNPAIRPIGATAPVPSRSSLSAALSGPASNPALGNLGGQVLDAQTGQQLWQQNAAQPMTPASTGKLFAVSAALLDLDPHHRFTTKVVRGPTPGSVVLVGGGDPTLSTLPPGQKSIYYDAPSVDDLANQVRAATGGHVTQVFVDNSRYVGPKMAPGWDNSDIAGGSVAPIDPVMVNGGRSDPTAEESPRSATPGLQAGQELAKRLGAGSVSEGVAPPRAQGLGEVRSPTVQDMAESVLTHSDNVGAETLAREVALHTGNEPSFAGAVKAVREVLSRNGFAMNGVQMQDGSGLSKDDRVRPADIATAMEAASSPANDERTRRLRGLLAGLPVAGGTGTLGDRYHDSPARGWVRAKTGTLNGANGITGTVLTQDGRLLVFAFLSNGPSSAQARPALDKIAEALRGCGCR